MKPPRSRGPALLLATLVASAGLFPGHGPAPLDAQTPTRLLVRAVANDAKVIGSGVGGARITVRDARTGKVLAEGIQEGSTGDTRAIVRAPRERGGTVFDTPGTAHFLATLDLTGPTPVEVSAEGPLDTPHAVQEASKTILMLPGHDVVGEGLVLVLNGFTVEIVGVDPRAAQDGGAVPLDVEARVTMLCGCPTEPGGLWDADRIRITAKVLSEGETVAEQELTFTGETSHYGGTLELPRPGNYEIRVEAVDAERANTGMAERSVTVEAR